MTTATRKQGREMKEREVIYRCGWCGFPCDEDGQTLPLEYDEATAYLRDNKGAHVKQVNGSCCPGGDQQGAPTP